MEGLNESEHQEDVENWGQRQPGSFVNTAINYLLPCKAVPFFCNLTTTGSLRRPCTTNLQCLRFETWCITHFERRMRTLQVRKCICLI